MVSTGSIMAAPAARGPCTRACNRSMVRLAVVSKRKGATAWTAAASAAPASRPEVERAKRACPAQDSLMLAGCAVKTLVIAMQKSYADPDNRILRSRA